MTDNNWRFLLTLIFVISGLALGYSVLMAVGAIDYARDELRYLWGCPSGEVMAADLSCVPPTFYPENGPAGERT